MLTRKISIAVGVLFILQMVFAMVGNSFTQAFIGSSSNTSALYTGVFFMFLSACAVVGIGVLSYRVLKTYNKKLALWYPILRGIEFTVSTGCGIYLLTHLQAIPNQMLWLYLPTAIGGLVFTYLLYASRFVPRFIAGLGLVGYIALLLGTVLNFLGDVDLNAGLGMVLLTPGGLFEVIVLPLWLFAKGFKLSHTAARV